MEEALTEEVTISLTRAEVLVIGACIDKVVDHAFENSVIDMADRQALWSLVSALERACADSFRHDYSDLLKQSKSMMGDFSQ